MKEMKLHTKNCRTEKNETICQRGMDSKDWGFSFLVDSELDAYKAAYIYKDSPHGVLVEYAHGSQSWMITVFNKHGAEMKLDGSRQ